MTHINADPIRLLIEEALDKGVTGPWTIYKMAQRTFGDDVYAWTYFARLVREIKETRCQSKG